MEAITFCGAIILAFGLWLEFETIIMRVARAIFGSKIIAGMMASSTVQRPVYVKYMEGTR